MHRERRHTAAWDRIRSWIRNRRKTDFGFFVLLFSLALTGFAQMPIFKRYYIADIPGLGWLDRYFVTHFIHYLAAVLFLFMASYRTGLYMLAGRARRSLTAAGRLRAGLLFGIIATGLFLVVRNLSGVWIPPAMIGFMDLTHLGLVMAFLTAAFGFLIFSRPWTQPKPIDSVDRKELL